MVLVLPEPPQVVQERVEEHRLQYVHLVGSPAVYLVAMFLAAFLALLAVSSGSFLKTKPSPLHRGHSPVPPQSEHSSCWSCCCCCEEEE